MNEKQMESIFESVEAIGSVVIGTPVESPTQSLNDSVMSGIEQFQRLAEGAEDATKEIDRLIQVAIDAAPENIKDRIAQLRNVLESITAEQTAVSEQIKMGVSALGSTVKHGRVTAVYTEGRESADIAMLKGMAAFYPPISQAFKRGAPSVSIRLK